MGQRSKLSVKKLLDFAKKEMNLSKSIKIYREKGTELTSSTLHFVRNNDTLYISDGGVLQEPYRSVAPKLPINTMALCVMGVGAVGKSALTMRFIKGQFIANYDPTIEDAYKSQICLDGHQIIIDILDTAGQEDFECLRETWMKNKDGFLFVFDV